MNSIPENYLEKVYAGVLGKAIGVRLGAPVEPAFWTHDRIESVYGDLRGYVKDFTNFAADDDTNGPIFFIRAMEDYCRERELTAEDVGNTWLNYTSEGHGMFWWGGYGISTEHTAYLNLKNGISAPQSGSIAQNGATLAEQIGGQIFIDSWGLIWPGNPVKAAEYAEKAASVSHDKNGIYGGIFNAVCIARAFLTADINDIVNTGLKYVPADSEFMRVNQAVIKFHKDNPGDFRACFKMLERDFGYDKYRGICHMIPNAGVVTLALLYGSGSLSRTVEIATMCGWDTDCNAGNAGTIAGVAYGIASVEAHYRRPINDMLVASCISGSLNIVDIPTFVKEITRIGYRVADVEVPAEVLPKADDRELYYDFELAGSTHGMRLDMKRFSNCLGNIAQDTLTGTRSLRVELLDHRRNDCVKLYTKPFYRRADFDDERYLPTFSPQVYPGQKVKFNCRTEMLSGEDLLVSFYVRLTHSKSEITSKCIIFEGSDWREIEWVIPDTNGEAIDEIGLRLENSDRGTFIGYFYVDFLHISGAADYHIDFAKEKEEFNCVTQFTYNRGKWSLEDGCMQALAIEDAEAFTGNYYSRDYSLRATLIPQCGSSHMLAFRVKGLMMGYYVGFDGENRVSLIKNEHGKKTVASSTFQWTHGRSYEFALTATGNRYVFAVDGEELFDYCDTADNWHEHGMYGFALLNAGRCLFEKLTVKES
ncbi:MAG: ADP-ribosylglycohydrolase family protein [Negativicutes bacterium]|jgi:ADP-ribosylglycohydrolase